MRSFETLFGINIENVQWNQIRNVTDWGITEELIEIKLKRQCNSRNILELKKLFQQCLKKELNLDRTQFQEINGATKFFNSILSNDNFKLGIATGGWEETANLKLEAIGINSQTLAYSNSNYFKTRKEITLDVIKQMNDVSDETPNEIIYFGDGEWDFQTCKEIDIRFIGIDSGGNDKLKRMGALEVYRDFSKPELIIESIMSSNR